MKAEVKTLLILGLLLRIALLYLTPPTDTPSLIPYYNDELAHLNYVRYLSINDKLPVQTQSINDGIEKGEFEYYQPPLYYFLARPFYDLGRRITPEWEYLWVRSISLLLVMAGVLIFFNTVRKFFRDSTIATSTLLLVALSGIPLRFGSIVTNDSLLFLISCFYFALILQILLITCDWKLLCAGIIIITAGLWTKASFIALLPILPMVLLFSRTRSWWKVILSFIVPLAAILPWYLRNYEVYGGFIPLSVGFGQPEPITSSNLLWRLTFTGIYFVRTLVLPFDQLWGGSCSKVIQVMEGLGLLAFISVGIVALLKYNSKLFRLSVAAIGLNLISYIFLNLNYFQAEARLFIPALPFIFLTMAFGADRIVGGRKSLALGILGLWVMLPWIGAVLFQ